MKKILLASIMFFVLAITLVIFRYAPRRIVYEAEIVDKQIMVVDENHCEYCLQITYELNHNVRFTKWICDEWSYKIGYTINDVGDTILYKTWKYPR